MGLSINLARNNYFGITSFDSITSQKQKNQDTGLAAIYSAGSQAAGLNALTTAMGSLRSAAAGESNTEVKAALNAKLASITTAMKNNFNLSNSNLIYSKTETGSLYDTAREQAKDRIEQYKATHKSAFDETV